MERDGATHPADVEPMNSSNSIELKTISIILSIFFILSRLNNISSLLCLVFEKEFLFLLRQILVA